MKTEPVHGQPPTFVSVPVQEFDLRKSTEPFCQMWPSQCCTLPWTYTSKVAVAQVVVAADASIMQRLCFMHPD